MERLRIDRNLSIDAADLRVRFVRSPGPGGQNVNRVLTKVEVRFTLSRSTALGPEQKQRLAKAFPAHAARGGDFIVTSNRYRSQQRNLEDALEKLGKMIRSIRRPPRRRVPTAPSKASRRRRVQAKRERGELKRQRRSVSHD